MRLTLRAVEKLCTWFLPSSLRDPAFFAVICFFVREDFSLSSPPFGKKSRKDPAPGTSRNGTAATISIDQRGLPSSTTQEKKRREKAASEPASQSSVVREGHLSEKSGRTGTDGGQR